MLKCCFFFHFEFDGTRFIECAAVKAKNVNLINFTILRTKRMKCSPYVNLNTPNQTCEVRLRDFAISQYCA